MTINELITVHVDVNQDGEGELSVSRDNIQSLIWGHIKSFILARKFKYRNEIGNLRLSWPDTLTIIREFGTRSVQSNFSFRFSPTSAIAKKRLADFTKQVREVRQLRSNLSQQVLSNDAIQAKLHAEGFTKRDLKEFQIRDLSHLLTLTNGANFSVPGAGKTTVTFALHVLIRHSAQHIIIIAPKTAFQAWKDVVEQCIDSELSHENSERFIVLDSNRDQTDKALESGATRFLISYDLAVRYQSILTNYLATHPTHLVLDESHRMKAGWASQRGAFLLGIATLPIRRDILSGTPMPQSASDIESQLEFLWPGQGLGREIALGKPPRSVLGNLYVRTTKKELGLPKNVILPIHVKMNDGQLALYSIVRDEFLRSYAKTATQGLSESQLLKARRSVMRLLQLSVNPSLAVNAMVNDGIKISSSIIDTVLDEGHSPKIRAVIQHAKDLTLTNKKVVIWTIFTGTIYSLDNALADLNPVYIHGGVLSGSEEDETTREGKIRRFHQDKNCSVLIANPATAGEGISLHTVCHNAIYLDRSYVSTHYLQSIDRIHRLGLPANQETNTYIYMSCAPAEIGSIDMSVSRRLVEKIRNMQELLDDPDLHEIAYAEEQANDPIDYDVSIDDIVDLICELQNKASGSFKTI